MHYIIIKFILYYIVSMFSSEIVNDNHDNDNRDHAPMCKIVPFPE